MAKLSICPHGHQWKQTANFDTQKGVQQLCPRCGAWAAKELMAWSNSKVALETRSSPAVGDTETDLAELKNLTDYELMNELGRGGMGVVYRAYDRRRDHVVALKTLQRADAASLHRFKQEFRSLANVAHANLVTLYELVSDGRAAYHRLGTRRPSHQRKDSTSRLPERLSGQDVEFSARLY